MNELRADATPLPIDGGERYLVGGELGAGGMASVHLGMLRGAEGFSRLVAIKRLHAHLRGERDVCDMLLDEARLASKVRHPNVVPVIDAFTPGDAAHRGDLHLVMEYVDGVALSQLFPVKKRREGLPAAIAVGLICDALAGLSAVHTAVDESGQPLHIVHRDITPQNLLVGVDGVVRVTDFGIARAANRLSSTHHAERKGKASYMAPEQVDGRAVNESTDVFSAAVVLWELLTGRRLFSGETDAEIFEHIRAADVRPPSALSSDVPAALDDVVLAALAHDPQKRPASAHDFALALQAAVARADAKTIAAWMAPLAAPALAARTKLASELKTRGRSVRPAPLDSLSTLGAGSGPSARSTDAQDAAPARKRGAAGWGLVVLSLSVLVLGAIVWFSRPQRSARASAPAATEPSSVSSASQPKAEGSASSAASPASSASTSAMPPTDRPPPLRLPPSVSAPTTHPPLRTTQPSSSNAASTASARAPDCNPPYVLDSLGRKIYRRECL